MELLSLLKRGVHHTNFNEDFLFSHQLNDDIIVCAVMDGCSTAKESHFTSNLFAKSLFKTCRVLPQMKEILEEFDLEKMAVNEIGEYILSQLFEDVRKAKKLFFLQVEELLSTLVLLLYHKEKKQASIHISGDGIFSVNGKITEIDQNNVPNFLGYHLTEKFEEVYKNDIESKLFTEVTDVAIATDGLSKLVHAKSKLAVVDLFLKEKPRKDLKDYYENQYAKLTQKGFVALDDIAIIRLVL